MPAPKAILRDIADLGLDPHVAYSICGKDGRITASPKAGAKQPAGVLFEIAPKVHVLEPPSTTLEEKVSAVHVDNNDVKPDVVVDHSDVEDEVN